jgi:hypothetical protein
MAKWVGDARIAEAAEQDSDSEDDEAPMIRVPSGGRCSRAWPLSVLFGGTVKHSKRAAEFNEEEELMEAFAEQMEDERPDDGAIEQDDDVYIP